MINIAKYLLLAYLLFKPFYVFGSGGLQPADVFLLLAFSLLFICLWHAPSGRKRLIGIFQEHRLFVIFVGCTIIINTIYMLIYPELKFALSSLYFVFDLLAVVLFTVCLRDNKFLQRAGYVFKFNMLLQLGIWAVGVGRLYADSRYMGTLNDPNQFGYYILLSLLFIYAVDMLLNNKKTYIYYIIAFFLILQSESTGMLLGIGVFSILVAMLAIKKQLESPYILLRRVMYSIATVAVLAIPISVITFSYLNSLQRENQVSLASESSIFSRLDEKTKKASGDASMSVAEDRNLDTIAEYPYYLLYGSGEGALDRFIKASHPGGEIHSTFPSIIFYYGTVPFLIIVMWIYRQLRGTGWQAFIVYMSLFTTSFILLNQRQALFWVLIVLCSMFGLQKVREPAAKTIKGTVS